MIKVWVKISLKNKIFIINLTKIVLTLMRKSSACQSFPLLHSSSFAHFFNHLFSFFSRFSFRNLSKEKYSFFLKAENYVFNYIYNKKYIEGEKKDVCERGETKQWLLKSIGINVPLFLFGKLIITCLFVTVTL